MAVGVFFWSFCILLSLICTNCTCTQLFLVPYNLFVFCCLRRHLSSYKHCSKGVQVPGPSLSQIHVKLLGEYCVESKNSIKLLLLTTTRTFFSIANDTKKSTDFSKWNHIYFQNGKSRCRPGQRVNQWDGSYSETSPAHGVAGWLQWSRRWSNSPQPQGQQREPLSVSTCTSPRSPSDWTILGHLLIQKQWQLLGEFQALIN